MTKDIAGGYKDGSLWAIGCEDNIEGDFDVLKWDSLKSSSILLMMHKESKHLHSI